MKLTISYKHDGSKIPFCAFTYVNGEYKCYWSSKGFVDAETLLIESIENEYTIIDPVNKEIEVKIP